MASIGTILQEAIKIRSSFGTGYKESGAVLQLKTLKKLLDYARQTEFGKAYDFRGILRSEDVVKEFQNVVPLHDYNSLYEKWWHRAVNDEADICWPGDTKYFALTSGTSASASKRIPVTSDMIRSVRRTSLRQTLTLSKLDLPNKFFEKSILMLGGSTSLKKIGNHYEGDLSGILAKTLPFWFYKFYKPGKKIAREPDWQTKLDLITREAQNWDIGIIAGVPAWVQILIEKIIDHYKLENIHDIWPNFKVFVHGGVSFSPYKTSFEKLLGNELIYLETYLASEGYLAFQNDPFRSDMQLMLNTGIFFEFIPFNEQNFDMDGQLVDSPEVLTLDQVEEGRDYAIIISTCAGTWRYLIGDTVKFTSLENYEILITGRTKHFLSLCGEHLSMENMTQALTSVAGDLGIKVKEFTVAGEPFQNLFAHRWYIGTEDPVDENMLKEKLDKKLKELNDDYSVERKAALKEVFVHTVPPGMFYDWMKSKGKEGGQNKFPRVLKGERLKDWQIFLQQTVNS